MSVSLYVQGRLGGGGWVFGLSSILKGFFP
jgi:hypothetical protein